MAVSMETSGHSMPLLGQNAAAKTTYPELKASSTFVLPDSSVLYYSLEGNSSPDSPVLVFINDIFVNLQIWDPSIAILKQRCPQYRLLRYDMRGYATDSIGTSVSITLSLLISDLQFLIQNLSISHIHAIIGLGFGANIGLALLADCPSLSTTFIGVSFAVRDSAILPRQTAVDEWALRSSLARRVGMGILADKAVSKWFTADARGTAQWVRVREMIAAGSIQGMEKLSNAVLECVGHVSERRGWKMLQSLNVPTLFLCGSGDGALPEEMETYPAMMRTNKGTFLSIARASRLACCEKPTEFVDVLQSWLDGFL